MYTGESYQAEVKAILGCEKCSLSESRTNIVIYRGNPRSNIMFIAEAPGKDEDFQAKPMVGLTGSYLVDLLAVNGLTLHEYYISNTVLCRPINNATPTTDQIAACSKWLLWQIEKVDPKIIVAVGAVALSALDPGFKMGKDRITQREMKESYPPHLRGRMVIPILHPSAIKRAPHREEAYKETIKALVAKIREIIPVPG